MRARRLSAERLVTMTRNPAARASAAAAVATPPPAPWISTVSPGSAWPRVKSMRYAVVHATVMHPASAIVMNAGFAQHVAHRHDGVRGKRPGETLRHQSPVRVERLVSAARIGIAERSADNDFVATFIPAGDVAAEHHRELVGTHPDAFHRPQVVHVDRRRGDANEDVAVGCDRVWPVVAQFEHRQRIGFVDAGRNRCPHVSPFQIGRVTVALGNSPTMFDNPWDPRQRTDLTANERVMLHFMSDCMHGDDLSLVDRYVAEGYIQHTPGIGQGREGLRHYLHEVAWKRPGRREWRPIQLFASGDFVILHKLLPAVVIADFLRFDRRRDDGRALGRRAAAARGRLRPAASIESRTSIASAPCSASPNTVAR